MFGLGILEQMIVFTVVGVLLVLAVALLAVIRRNRMDPGAPPHAPAAGHWERAVRLRERRDHYRVERSRILGMVDAGTIAPEEADRLLDTVQREVTTMDCPRCGREIRAEAVKCPHCRQFLADGLRRPHRLARSRDKLVAGVCGGLAEYADIDPSIVRVVVALAILFTGVVTGLVLYLVAALLLPAADP